MTEFLKSIGNAFVVHTGAPVEVETEDDVVFYNLADGRIVALEIHVINELITNTFFALTKQILEQLPPPEHSNGNGAKP